MAKKPTLETIDAALARWKTRLKRSVTAIDKLEKQKRRLVRKVNVTRKDIDAAILETYPTIENIQKMKREAAERVGAMIEQAGALPPVQPTPPVDKPADNSAPVAHDLAIPTFLRRSLDPTAERIREEIAETKKKKAAGRIAKMKAKKAGELNKMPLSGRAALDAIKNG